MEKAPAGEQSSFGKAPIGRIWFPGEKIARSKEGGRNSQNNRIWAFAADDPALRIQEGDRFSKGVMVSLAASKCGVGGLVFVAEGEKINGPRKKKTPECEFAPDIHMKMASRSSARKWRRQQDMAPSRGEKSVQGVLKNRSIAPNLLPWIPKGADLSPLDFAAWGYMGAKLAGRRGSNPVANGTELRSALLATRASNPQSSIDSAVDSFKGRVARLEEANGGHFEHEKKK